MKDRINSIFLDREESPLYYIESGSRLWGMAGPNSDHDVRGIHLQSKKQYYDFKSHREVIEVKKGDFDFVSFNIDKAFRLLAKSNPNVLEWMRAPPVYINQVPEWESFQSQILENIEYKALYHHYLSMAKSNLHLLEKDKKFTYKTLIYCLRGLLAAELASENILAALRMEKLFGQFDTQNEILSLAQYSLDMKTRSPSQKSVPEIKKQEILQILKKHLAVLEQKVPEGLNKKHQMETILRRYSILIKSRHYDGNPCISLFSPEIV